MCALVHGKHGLFSLKIGKILKQVKTSFTLCNNRIQYCWDVKKRKVLELPD